MEQRYCYGCMKPKTQSPICEHCGFDERTQNAPHQLPIGMLLQNQYVIGRVLGQGGFGITYIGWDRHLAIPVAIKEYFPSGVVHRQSTVDIGVTCYTGVETQAFASHRERFIREARTLAQLSGVPEIVQVRNFFTTNNTAYIIMEYVQGITLKDYFKRLGRRMQEQELLNVMEPVVKALMKVHSRNLIHRDISPDNIMLPNEGGVKLIDFGTVRSTEGSMIHKGTEAILKPGFAPIEQYQTHGKLGPWTDVYALCATMHYCLTGRIPEDALERLENGRNLEHIYNTPGLSAGIRAVLEKGLAVRISDRIQSMEELYRMLYGRPVVQPYGNTGSTGTRPNPPVRENPPVPENPKDPVPRQPVPQTPVRENQPLFGGWLKNIAPEAVLAHCESVSHKPILVETYLQQCVNQERITEDVAKQILAHYKKVYVPKPEPREEKPQKTRKSSDGSVFGGFRGEIPDYILDYCESVVQKPVLVETHIQQCMNRKRITQEQARELLEYYRSHKPAQAPQAPPASTPQPAQGGRVFCSECGQSIPQRSKFCFQCGSSVREIQPNSYPQWSCSACRSQVPVNSKYCPSCGQPVTDPIVRNAPESVCVSCGAKLYPGSKFCVECGTPIGQKPAGSYPEGHCPSCGKKLSDHARFCIYCGKPVK